jgi:hypothetical protein
MKVFTSSLFVFAILAGSPIASRADDDGKAILDKAIKAAGGEEKLAAAKSATWKAKGKISFGGMDSEFTSSGAAQGDKYRQEFESEFGGMKVKGIIVVNGDKGWQKFGDDAAEMDKDALANQKRNNYLQLAPSNLVALKGKGYKISAGAETKVDGKACEALKVTGPDGKEFTLLFDKETNLPVKQIAPKVAFIDGMEMDQETIYSNYKDFGGIKLPAKAETVGRDHRIQAYGKIRSEAV